MTPRNPRRTLLVALVLVLAAGVFGGPVAGLLSTAVENFQDSQSESVQARNELEAATGVNPGVSLVALVEPAAQAGAVRRELARDPAVARIVPGPISRDGRATYLAVSLKPIPSDQEDEVATRIEKRFAGDPGVRLGGALIAGKEVGDQVGKDLARAETIAFPLLFLISLFVFRGLVAALLPLVGGLVSIVSTLITLRIANEITPLSVFALNLVTGLGLGLAIDYSLFMVSRYREELAAVGPGREALERTLRTAGRTVAFSALTVAAAMAALLAFRQPFLYSMGIGGIFVALLSAVHALVVLPAILMLLGPRVNAGAPKRFRRAAERRASAEDSGFWYRLAQWVMRRAALVAAATAAFLIALGIPFTHIRFTGVDASVLPKSASARQVSDELQSRFSSDRSSPIYIAFADAPPASLVAQLRRLPGAREVSLARQVGRGAWQIDIVPAAPGLDPTSKRLVKTVRDLLAPYPAKVGGETASFLDNQASLRARLPLAIAILALTTLVLLFAMTGSVILPLKSLVMNLLTLSATFGLLVLIFQDGRLEGLLGYTSQGALESTQPILLAAIAFGLSTDYAVFLLTRIKEAHDSGLSNTEAVARGLERTGRIITSAALLFCIAIGAFSTSKIIFIKELGIGTGLAVVLDATIVRALLVPSLMRLLGDWNWWAPRPLRLLYDRFGLREAA